MKILVFGNSLVQKDSLALKLSRVLKTRLNDIEFKEFDSAENLEDEGRDLIILDVAEGIERVEIIEDISVLEKSPTYSTHDFDLTLTLKLLNKMKKIDSVKIIAIPVNYPIKKALKETTKQLNQIK